MFQDSQYEDVYYLVKCNCKIIISPVNA